jgi:hypothetical protein
MFGRLKNALGMSGPGVARQEILQQAVETLEHREAQRDEEMS